jgi:hypothetical protein
MAARLHKLHQDDIRQKIQASNLVHRLQKCAEGELELTPAQLKAIEMLLDRSVSKLSQIQLTGDSANPLEHHHKIEFVSGKPTATK